MNPYQVAFVSIIIPIMATDLKSRIIERLNELGLSAEGASKKAGLSRAFLRKLMERDNASARGDSIIKLAAALETSESWLLNGVGSKEVDAGKSSDAGKLLDEIRPADVQLPPRSEMPLDVPVLGTAAGSIEGEFQFEGGVIDYVRRPPALANTKDAYTIYVVGSSMEPKYNSGDACFVNPNKPARIGDPVIVQLARNEHDGVGAMIGLLRRRTPEFLLIGKLNPASEIKLPTKTILKVHRVLEINDLFGI